MSSSNEDIRLLRTPKYCRFDNPANISSGKDWRMSLLLISASERLLPISNACNSDSPSNISSGKDVSWGPPIYIPRRLVSPSNISSGKDVRRGLFILKLRRFGSPSNISTGKDWNWLPLVGSST